MGLVRFELRCFWVSLVRRAFRTLCSVCCCCSVRRVKRGVLIFGGIQNGGKFRPADQSPLRKLDPEQIKSQFKLILRGIKGPHARVCISDVKPAVNPHQLDQQVFIVLGRRRRDVPPGNDVDPPESKGIAGIRLSVVRLAALDDVVCLSHIGVLSVFQNIEVMIVIGKGPLAVLLVVKAVCRDFKLRYMVHQTAPFSPQRLFLPLIVSRRLPVRFRSERKFSRILVIIIRQIQKRALPRPGITRRLSGRCLPLSGPAAPGPSPGPRCPGPAGSGRCCGPPGRGP